MLFSSLEFLYLFLPITLLLYFVCPPVARNAVLLIVSLIFYGFGEPVYVLLMMVSITINYLSGLLIGRAGNHVGMKRLIIVLNVIANLGMLGYFKYAGFAVTMLQKIPAFSGMTIPEIALPIGISF